MIRRGRTILMLAEAFGSRPFSLAEASQAGVSQRRVNRAFQCGDLDRVARGVYRIGHGTDSRTAHLAEVDAVLERRPRAALAGVSAAAAWDLPCPHPWGNWSALPRTLCCEPRLRSAPNLVRLRSEDRSIVHRSNRPVTDLIDTALDVAWQLPTPSALIVVDAVARRLVGSDDRFVLGCEESRIRIRQDLLERLARRRPQPGLRRMRTTASLADPAAESPPESFIRGHLMQDGVPAPVVNAPVTGASGRRYFLDLFWPAAGIGLEVDGAVKYVDLSILLQEKRRQEDIEATGIRLIRTMAADAFADPAAGVRAVRRTLGLR